MSIPSIFSDDTEPSLAFVTPTQDWRVKLTAADKIEFINKNTATTVLTLGPDGNVTFANFSFPTDDGTAGQILGTDGAGNLGFTSGSGGGGLGDIVDDTTPQLGGQLDAQNFKIINLATPTLNTDAVTKAYVDSVAAGLDPKESVRLATASGDLSTFTFTNNGGVGDILTAPGAGFTSVDSENLADGDRVLVKNQSTATQNGIYVASDTGSGGTTVLTRATDQDGTPSNEVSAGNFTFVEIGSTNGSTGWVVIGNGIITINAGNIDWAKFSDVTGALVNLIDDITPQLGGDLDVNGKSIVSVSNGDISITPDGAGNVILDGLTWPSSDGTAEQNITTDGSGNLSFSDAFTGFDIAFFVGGSPDADEIAGQFIVVRNINFPINLTGSAGFAAVAATASTTFDIQKNGGSIGSMNFAISATVATFTFGSPVSFIAGDIFKVIAPASPDVTLADISMTFKGTRT